MDRVWSMGSWVHIKETCCVEKTIQLSFSYSHVLLSPSQFISAAGNWNRHAGKLEVRRKLHLLRREMRFPANSKVLRSENFLHLWNRIFVLYSNLWSDFRNQSISILNLLVSASSSYKNCQTNEHHNQQRTTKKSAIPRV
jgi:hypothetical protein